MGVCWDNDSWHSHYWHNIISHLFVFIFIEYTTPFCVHGLNTSTGYRAPTCVLISAVSILVHSCLFGPLCVHLWQFHVFVLVWSFRVFFVPFLCHYLSSCNSHCHTRITWPYMTTTLFPQHGSHCDESAPETHWYQLVWVAEGNWDLLHANWLQRTCE